MNYKKLLQQLASLILIASFLAACGPPPTTGQVKGRVFRSDTNTPIANAAVSLTSQKSGESIGVAKTTTDEQGNYSFAEIEPGTYSLSISWTSTCRGGDFFSQNDWLVIVAAEPRGKLVAVLNEEFTIAAGDVLKRNLDLDLKFCP